MSVMNPGLFAALSRVFPRVGVTNPGVKAEYRRVQDFFNRDDDKRPNRKSVLIRHWGETYNVSCPYCGDTRDRLYFSHIWGTVDEQAWTGRMLDPVVCQNEHCSMSDMWNYLFSGGAVYRSSKVEPVAQLREAHRMSSPGDTVPLTSLDAGHPALQYLRGRGYDLDELGSRYQVCYCARSPWVIPATNGRLPDTPAGRIIVPNLQAGEWKGWVARYVGEIPRNKDGKPMIRKYLNAPGYQFSSTLYNLDEVVEVTGGDLCVVNEGPFSAISCDGVGVATFGLVPKPMQEDLLAAKFASGTVIILAEHEARDNPRLTACVERLGSRVAGGCLSIFMEPGVDAGTLGANGVLELVRSEMQCRKNR